LSATVAAAGDFPRHLAARCHNRETRIAAGKYCEHAALYTYPLSSILNNYSIIMTSSATLDYCNYFVKQLVAAALLWTIETGL